MASWGAQNLPDDWGMHYQTCRVCGGRYHASEGGCDCLELCKEYQDDKIHDEYLKCQVVEVYRFNNIFSRNSELGTPIPVGTPVVQLDILLPGNIWDEWFFTEGEYAQLLKWAAEVDPEEWRKRRRLAEPPGWADFSIQYV